MACALAAILKSFKKEPWVQFLPAGGTLHLALTPLLYHVLRYLNVEAIAPPLSKVSVNCQVCKPPAARHEVDTSGKGTRVDIVSFSLYIDVPAMASRALI